MDIQELPKFGNLELLAKQVVEGFVTGLHRSPFHGFSVEFSEHRLYNPGESTKNIDWKLYARTDKLFVKRYEEETNLRCRFVLDISSSMYFPEITTTNKVNKLGYSVYAIASLMELLKKQRDAAGITLFNDKIIAETAIKSSNKHHKLIYAELEGAMKEQQSSLNHPTKLIEVLHQIAESTHKRSLIVIFSDLFSTETVEDLTEAFLHLKHNKHEVILFHVLDKDKEINFDFINKPTEFIDLETGRKVKVHPNEVKNNYKLKVKERIDALKLKCSQFKIDYIETDINQGVEFTLQQYLIKRSKMI
ncbi:DUF58 domain-containing protein [Putridiphycobacter roseus]|uniref:DUF58 domain-containing protein n=1 Tax=Putridiphycobacter roseus TaxID=2219161 RepID=A0A2W1NIV5_9FLAO|nr:DUF58 domain-containing protein [Putridiphycobacter roseus]